jgi:hypothetical protein
MKLKRINAFDIKNKEELVICYEEHTINLKTFFIALGMK